MKKLLAILLSVTLLFSVLAINTMSTSAAVASRTVPTVRIITNEGSPVNGEFETYFTVRFDNFLIIDGIDIEVTAINAKITDVKTVNLPEAVDDIESDKENYDLSEDKTLLHFVDFNTVNKGRIIIRAISPDNTAQISVKGEYAENGDDLFEITTQPGIFEIKQVVTPKNVTGNSIAQPAQSTNTFLPYGSVYAENGETTTYADKATDGSFDTSAGGFKYTTFNLPKSGTDAITPFGVSEKYTGDALMFGNYSEYDDCATADDITAVEHGTMVFEGDWLSLKEYYIKNGNTVQELVRALYDDYDSKIPSDGSTKRVTYRVPSRDGSSTTKVNLYKFPRVKYMWRDGNGKLEYAIRLHGAKEGTTYTSVAYCIDEQGNVYISHHVKSAVAGGGEWNSPDLPPVSGSSSETPDTPTEPEEPTTVVPTMTQGTVDGSTGKISSGVTTRLTTEELLPVADYSTITIANGYKGYFHCYDADGTWLKSFGWRKAEDADLAVSISEVKYHSSDAVYFRVVVGTLNDDNITADTFPSDGLVLTKAS